MLFGLPVADGFYIPTMIVGFAFFAVIAMPLGALAITFGEEYGWRGFLQDELVGIGMRKAALLIGLIGGLWHIPILLTGFIPTRQRLQGLLTVGSSSVCGE